MHDSLALQLYYGLPLLRNTLASIRGLQLRHWRYGGESAALIQAAVEREHWTAAQWQHWQQAELHKFLLHARTQVPYYRDYWDQQTRAGRAANAWETLANWPILDKTIIRANFERLVADTRHTEKTSVDMTSGTSGQPVRLVNSRSAARRWYALCEARLRYWHGLGRADRWANFGGKVIVPVGQTKPPFWVWSSALNQLYLSPYHLSPQNLDYYLDAIRDHRVKYILGLSSALKILAQRLLETGREDVRLQVILTSSEQLTRSQRQTIAAGFRCPVRETYGTSEYAIGASECEHGSMHLWPDVGMYELWRDGQVVEAGTGDLLTTSFVNPVMPLIRYKLGDRVTLPAPGAVCACGRTLPLLGSIDGRSGDVLIAADGREVSPANTETIFDIDVPFAETQICQKDIGCFEVRYVPNGPVSRDHLASLALRMKQRFGEVRIDFCEMAAIPRGPNGKFRAVVSEIPEARRLQAVREG